MQGILYVGNPEWLAFHRKNRTNGVAAFYRLPWKEWLTNRMMFLQEHGSPPRAIVAAGQIASVDRVHQTAAWQKYGAQLGAATESDWRAQAATALAEHVEIRWLSFY